MITQAGKKKLVFVVLCWILAVVQANAQDSSVLSIHEQIPIQTISSSEGLPNNRVLSIAQDHEGFIWLATMSGLAKYDGITLWNYKNNKTDSFSLSFNRVDRVFCDSKDQTWIFTRLQTQRYNYELNRFEAFTHPKLTDDLVRVTDAVEDAEGKLWFAASKLVCYDQDHDEITDFGLRENWPNRFISSVIIDKANSNKIWFGGRDIGVYSYDTKQDILRHYTATDLPNKQLLSIDIQTMYQDRNGDIWLGTNNNSAFCLKQGQEVFEQVLIDPGNSHSTRVRAFFEDPNGRFYVGTRGGLYQKQSEGFMQYADKMHPISKLKHNSILCSFRDRTGGVWLGTFAGGASYLNLEPKQFVNYRALVDDDRFLNNNLVYSVLEDAEGDLWVGTETGGLNHLDKKTGKWTIYVNDPKNPNSLASNEVRAIAQDLSGTIWIGLNKGGLCRFDSQTGLFTNYKNEPGNEHSLSGNSITRIQVDGDKLWLATGKELNLFDTKTGYVKRMGIDGRNMVKATDGRFWFGLIDTPQGVCVMDPKDSTFTKYLDPNIITSRSLSMIIDRQQAIWLGYEDGCARVDTKTGEFTIYNGTKGYPFEVVNSVLEDENGNIWLGTNNGLVEMLGAVDKPEHPVKYRVFGIKDGLPAREFTINSCYKNPDGLMYFGSVNGLTAFYPSKLKDNKYAPLVAVTDLKIFNERVAIGDTVEGTVVLTKAIDKTQELVLNYKHNVFSFEFSAFHFANPLENQYKFMMEGLETKWNYTTGHRHFATYTSLPGGEYTFLLKAANLDGVWNDKPFKIKVTILPPWWKTMWFRILVAVTVMLMGGSFFLYRVKQLKRQKAILEEKVMQRTQALSDANASLEEKQEEIMQQNEEIIQQNDEITRQKEMVDAKNVEVEDAYKSIMALSHFGQKITSTLDLTEIGDMIYRHIEAFLPLDVFGVGLFSAEHKRIHFIIFVEDGEMKPPFMSKLDDSTSLAAWCINEQKEVYCGNFENEYVDYINEIKVQSTNIPQSIIDIPLIMEQRSVGVLTLQSYQKHMYSEKDLTKIRSLASFLAIALDNASAYRTIEKQNNHIKDSISYAKNIQQAILPAKEFIAKRFESFVLFRPRDIVSGDFYWCTSLARTDMDQGVLADCPDCEEAFFVAAVDCTGHGVPGAFMSMIGSRLLSEIVNEKKVHDPAEILRLLDLSVVKALRQGDGGNDDGMDISLVRIIKRTGTNKASVVFSGAKSPLYYQRKAKGEVEQVRGSVKTIGGTRYTNLGDIAYTNTDMIFDAGDVIYLPTDGFIDQHNAERKRFGSNKLVEVLANIATLPMSDQKLQLEAVLDNHQENGKQRDDITLIGIRL